MQVRRLEERSPIVEAQALPEEIGGIGIEQLDVSRRGGGRDGTFKAMRSALLCLLCCSACAVK